MRKIGPIIAICTALFMAWFLYAMYPQPGYTQAERNSMNALIERNNTQDWDAIPRLSMADLVIEDIQ